MKIDVIKYGIGESLRQIREYFNDKREDFANDLNLKSRTLKSYELEERNINFVDEIKILNETGCILKIGNKKTNEIIVANNAKANEIFITLRNWTGLSLRRYGKEINMAGSSICNFEKGRRDYNFNLIYEICKKFDFTMIIER